MDAHLNSETQTLTGMTHAHTHTHIHTITHTHTRNRTNLNAGSFSDHFVHFSTLAGEGRVLRFNEFLS